MKESTTKRIKGRGDKDKKTSRMKREKEEKREFKE